MPPEYDGKWGEGSIETGLPLPTMVYVEIYYLLLKIKQYMHIQNKA